MPISGSTKMRIVAPGVGSLAFSASATCSASSASPSAALVLSVSACSDGADWGVRLGVVIGYGVVVGGYEYRLWRHARHTFAA